MKRTLRVLLIALAIVVVGIQLVPVDRSNPPVQAVVAAPPEVFAVLERACFDCHSNQTEWPWYSYIAPMSWFVAGHVDHAREEMNFTEWNRLNTREQAHKIKECWEEVEKGAMPLPSYLRMHSDARLTDGEKALIREWAMVAGERPGGEGEGQHSGHEDESR